LFVDQTPPVAVPEPSAQQDAQRDEIARFLSEDPSRMGDVYRGLERGLDAEAVAAELGVNTSNFVWNYSRIIAGLLDRELPTAPTVASQAARKFRSLLKRTDWSPGVRARLASDLEVLERRTTDVEAVVQESEVSRKQTAEAESTDTTGIYVYALPHYLRFPFDPDSGRTLLKVGRSDRDIIQRLRDQARTTALPEEPLLLRIYATGDLDTVDVEARFHRTLRAFDHGRAVERMAGREWFLTTTQALDAVADLLGLRPIVVNDDADFLEEA
jgi:hypothetical protein